ncbi:MAG TPA: PrsW family glutamic-type intramembrane protease [Dehalococcoidia bacterium]|nr:PrsW family glutamic-type intramembrane protease [Dehalococcoidia bacterium]
MEGIAIPADSPPPDPRARDVGPIGHLAAAAVAVAGALVAAPLAVIEELRPGLGLLLLPFVAAPTIEEILKPAGVYLLLVRWPRLVRGQLHTALLAALAGLAFGLLESAAFVTIAVDEPTRTFVAYRFTAPVAMHATASLIAGSGIGPDLIAWAKNGAPLPRRAVWRFGAAIALHAAYNLTAVALTLSGALDFD